jgi:hypothetical protein
MKMELDREVDIDILQQHLPSFAVSMGLALEGLGIAKNKLNFLPSEEQGASERIRKQYFILVACAVFYLLLIFMWLRQNRANAKLRELRDSFDQQRQVYVHNAQQLVGGGAFGDVEDNCRKLLMFSKYRNEDIKVLDTIFRNFPKSNDKIPAFLEKPHNILRFQDKIDSYDEMQKKNNEKIWLLEFESGIVWEKDAEEAEEAGEDAPLRQFRKFTWKVAKMLENNPIQTQKRVEELVQKPLLAAFREYGVKKLIVSTAGGLHKGNYLNVQHLEGGAFRLPDEIQDVEQGRYEYILFKLELKVPLYK